MEFHTVEAYSRVVGSSVRHVSEESRTPMNNNNNNNNNNKRDKESG